LKRKYRKYTKELLEPIVRESKTIVEVLTRLGVDKTNGGNNAYMSKRLKSLGIDTSHFVGQSWNKGRGRLRVGGSKFREPDDILVLKKEGAYREKAKLLRRALFEKGTDMKCFSCGIFDWAGKDITLEVDHINGNPLDNRIDNLQLLCPNCHSQTKNFRRYNG
jgi:hypothetical protein